MEKRLGLIGVFVLMFMLVSVSAIENQTDLELIDAGTTPDSVLYFLDLAIENLGIALTFDNELKIEKELRIAEERLSEVREMALKNNLKAMLAITIYL